VRCADELECAVWATEVGEGADGLGARDRRSVAVCAAGLWFCVCLGWGWGWANKKQFAKAAGATVIATTSSAQKAEILKKLGADHVINYREDPNWGETARKLSRNGEGVDHILEVGGEGTMTQSVNAIKMEGIISVIGVLTGTSPKETLMDTLVRLFTVRGVYVGSKDQLEEMIKAMEEHDIRPVVDEKVFTLETAKEAYEYMVSYRFQNPSFDPCLQCDSGRQSTLARLASRLTKCLDRKRLDEETHVWSNPRGYRGTFAWGEWAQSEIWGRPETQYMA